MAPGIIVPLTAIVVFLADQHKRGTQGTYWLYSSLRTLGVQQTTLWFVE